MDAVSMRIGLFSTLITTLLCVHGVFGEDDGAPEFSVDSLPVALADPTSQITGFMFLEGPVYDPVSQQIFFTDVSNNAILRMHADNTVWVVDKDMKGCAGLAIGPDGDLYVCRQMSGDIIKLDWDTKAMSVVVDATPEGDALNSPNDLVFDAVGGLYFTDPVFSKSNAEAWEQGVYYRNPDGNVRKINEDLLKPNGIALSPDQDTVYILPSGDPVLMAYPVMAPGVLGKGRRLAELPHYGDGMAIDSYGNIYVTQPDGMCILVINPLGQTINRFEFEDRPINCAFGGRGDGTLFVTCKRSLWTIPLSVAGHRPADREWPVIPKSHIHTLQYSAAQFFLGQLNEQQRRQVQVPLDDPSRTAWNYMTGTRVGLKVDDLDGNQKMALWQLVRGGLSENGFSTLHAIRMIEDEAHEAGREDVGADDFWITIYGEPANGTDWGWRFEGHHVSLNYFFDDGKLASTTPMFLGAQPQRLSSGMDAGTEPLGSVNAKARAFIIKLDGVKQAKAIVSDTAAGNIHTPMGGNEWSSTPEGLQGSELTPEEQQALLEIIRSQLDHAPPMHVKTMMDEYDGQIDEIHFAWYGGTGDGDPHAWAIYGPDLHIEYHDAQTPDDHVHTVWRRPNGDFGIDPDPIDDNEDKDIEQQSRVTSEEG